MFPTRNGTGVLFIPAYIDHGSTSGQSNGASLCYVSSCWIAFSYSNRTIPKCSRRANLQEQEDSTSESDLVSALPEALQFEVASKDDILENEANIPVHENIASTAEGILEDIMTGRMQGTPLDDEQEVEEEEVDQQPPNRPPSHSEALQHVHSLMQFAQSNLPHLQPTLTFIVKTKGTGLQPTFKRRNRQHCINFLPLQNEAKECCSYRSVVM